MGDMSINLASLPMGADPKTDQVVAWDELGRSIYQSQFGVQYFIEATAPPKGSAIRGAYNSLVQDPGGTLGAVGKNALAGMWGAVETPMNALRGMPITNGDVWNSAGLVSVGGAGMAAPEGALRSGAMRTTAQSAADDVLAMIKRGDAAKVTDEMMSAADPQTLWAGYDLPMDAASRAQRAKKMGATPKSDWLHGTDADIAAFDPARRVYVSKDTSIADAYARRGNDMAGTDGANYMPLRALAPPDAVNKANGYANFADPTKLRSQFARFDPRLSHLKNLSASIMAGGLGLSNLLDYLNSQNGEPQ